MRVPWTARRSNQSILKAISPGISLEGMMLKLKLQYFCHLMRRVDSLEKTLMLGGIRGRRRRGQQRMRWLDGITDSMDNRPSHHLCHSPLVRSGSQLLPGLTQGCERQGTGNAGVTLGSVHHKGCPQWGPDLAPPPVPAGLWVPVSGTGHPREAHRAQIGRAHV